MLKKRTAAEYVGGPLAGQPAVVHRGQASIYRDQDGNPIPAAQGTRGVVDASNAGKGVAPIYVRQDQGPTVTGPNEITARYLYVWAELFVTRSWTHPWTSRA